MAYNIKFANRFGEYISEIPKLEIEEKKMFRGLKDEIAEINGFQTMIKECKGYCYISP